MAVIPGRQTQTQTHKRMERERESPAITVRSRSARREAERKGGIEREWQSGSFADSVKGGSRGNRRRETHTRMAEGKRETRHQLRGCVSLLQRTPDSRPEKRERETTSVWRNEGSETRAKGCERERERESERLRSKLNSRLVTSQ